MRNGFSDFDKTFYAQPLPREQRLACLGVLALGVGPLLGRLPGVLATLLGLFAIAFALFSLQRKLSKWTRWIMAGAIVAFASIAASNDPHADLRLAVSFAALAAYGSHTVDVKAGLTTLILAIVGVAVVGSARATTSELVVALLTLWGVLAQSYRLMHLGQAEASRWGAAILQAVKMTLWGLPVAAAAFFIMPHVSLGFMHLYHPPLTGGGNDDMMPGEIDDLLPNPETAFRVRFLSDVPEPAQQYWRTNVLWSFDGLRWNRPEWAGATVRTRDNTDLSFAPSPVWRYRLQVEKPNLLVSLDGTQPGTGDSDVRWAADRVMLDPPLAVDAVWQASPLRDHREGLDDAVRAAALHLPPILNPQTHALVASWLAEDRRPEAIVQRALDLFRTKFHYTMRPGRLRTANRIDEFLQKREGYCEYFSSAFAVMMREAGIPARVVVGYQGGKPSSWGDWWRVLESDAHAWDEIWLEGKGWVRVDPTAVVPGFGEEPAAWRRLLSNDFFDWVSVKTAGAFKAVQQMTQGTALAKIDWDRWIVALIPVLLVVSAGLAWRLQKQSKRHQQRFQRIMSALSRTLARRNPGWERAPHEGVRAWAERVGSELPNDQADELRMLARWWSDYQFAGRQLFPEAQWRARARRFKVPKPRGSRSLVPAARVPP